MAGSRKQVVCPECGEQKESRGEKMFFCCGSRHKIKENLYQEDSGNKKDGKSLLSTNRGVNMTEDDDDGAEESESSENQEEVYECGNCGCELNHKRLKCSDCGKKFNWSAV